MPPRKAALTQEAAEAIAIRAVGFLAARESLMLRFMALTGLSIDDVKARLGDPETLGAVLDFILFDESLVTEFAAAIEVEPGVPAAARRKLPGAPSGA